VETVQEASPSGDQPVKVDPVNVCVGRKEGPDARAGTSANDTSTATPQVRRGSLNMTMRFPIV
jgi:hypothetical protein